jgi:DNA-binding winged helix-turn-helix (wHTH) protein/tetratricopeptide (TPR) repeat protein
MQFGGFELDVARHELRRGAEVVPLAPKPYELLMMLLEARPRVVSRDEIRDRIWPDVHVSEATIASTLRDLRRALGDEGYGSRFILTVRGVGFRFVAPVEGRGGALAVVDHQRIFVGRDALMAQLRAALGAARTGRGRIALLAGEPGVGKSRAAQELAEIALAQGFDVHVGRCRESVARPPYGPWVQILTALAESRAREEIVEAVGNATAELVRIAPAIADRLPATPLSSAASDQDAIYRLLDGVATLLRRLARRKPLVLVLDDLDRADHASLRLLEFVAADVAATPLLIVGTFRTSSLDADHPLAATLVELARQAPCERHYLEGLMRDDVREFVQCYTAVEASAQAIEVLHATTGGNPFFLRELVGHEVERTGGERLSAAGELHLELPPNLRDAIRGRLAELSEPVRRVLAVAAVLGREFVAGVVAQVTGLSESAIEQALDEARRAGLVAPASDGDWRFSHALIAEAIAGDLTPLARTRIHERIGATLGGESDETGAHLSEVANHLCEAAERVGVGAAEAAVRAAEHAARRLAFRDAAGFYERALELRTRFGADDPAGTCDLLLELARARLAVREVEKASESARSAAALARSIPSAERLARAALLLCAHVRVDSREPFALLEEALPGLAGDELALRAQVLSAMSMQLHYSWQPQRRLALSERGLREARQAADPDVVTDALFARRTALCTPESLAERLRIGEELISWADCNPRSHYRAFARAWRAVDLMQGGDTEAAAQEVQAVGRIAQEAGMPRFFSFQVCWSAMRAVCEGRFADAEAATREMALLMQRADDPNANAYSGMQLGQVYYELGRWDELDRLIAASSAWLGPHRTWVPAVRASLVLIDLLGDRREAAHPDYESLVADDFAVLDGDPDVTNTASWLASSIRRLGDAPRAEALLARLGAFGRQQTVFNFGVANRGSLARYLGMLARTSGRLDEAERHFEAAIESNRKTGAPFYEARSQLDLAELLARRGGGEERARQLAAEATAKLGGLGVREPARLAGI